MKIIGGTLKNRNFFMPEQVRPTQNIVRKAVFDILGQDLDGRTFLDIFAAGGAMGLEALSRGAAKVIFVEKDPKCVKVLIQNTELLQIAPSSYDILEQDGFAAIKSLKRKSQKFDIIYIDPPYGRDLGKKALKLFSAYDILHPNCIVVIEHHQKDFLPSAADVLNLFKQRTYGTTCVSFYHRKN